MNNRDVSAHKQRLDRLFERGAAFRDDPEMQAQWSRYLCVLVSGLIETSVRRIYAEYARKRANRGIARFIDRRLAALQNPRMENILQWAGAFSDDWQRELRDIVDGELAASVDSIVTIRHSIAHGGDAGIGYMTLRTYYGNAWKVLEEIERICESRAV